MLKAYHKTYSESPLGLADPVLFGGADPDVFYHFKKADPDLSMKENQNKKV